MQKYIRSYTSTVKYTNISRFYRNALFKQKEYAIFSGKLKHQEMSQREYRNLIELLYYIEVLYYRL